LNKSSFLISFIIILYIISYYPDQNVFLETQDTSFLFNEHPPMIFIQNSVITNISIINDNDFAVQALNNDWDGNGTFNNPYIIENITLSSGADYTPVLFIKNTQSFFILKNITISGGSYGILLENVTNGLIQNVSISYSKNELIYCNVATNLTIKESIFQESGLLHGGILIDYSNNINLSKNFIGNNKFTGIKTRDCKKIRITDNIITWNRNAGIVIAHTFNVIIKNNSIHDNYFKGLSVEGNSENITIEYNTIFNNMDAGIGLDSAINVQIFYNTIYNNTLWGIRVAEPCVLINVTINNIIENYAHTTSPQADCQTQGCLFYENFWSDWTAPDTDKNGIVDNSYVISEIYADSFPLTQVYPFTKLHILTKPNIYYPSTENIISGEIEIIWGIASDTLDHSVIYSVFYSSNNGTSWNEIILNYLSTSLNWDTKNVPNGDHYLIKVVAIGGCGLISYDTSNVPFAIMNLDSTTTETTYTSDQTSPFSFVLFLFALIFLYLKKN